MLKNLKIGMRVAISAGTIVLLTLALIIPFSLSLVSKLTQQAEERELRGYYNNIVAMIETRGQMAEALSEVVANIPGAKAAFMADDRDQLLQIFNDAYKILQREYGVKQFQFHRPPAISFLRVHKPAKFGDDLSSFRHTVVDVNTNGRRLHGLEKGVAGLGIRGVVPIKDNGQQLGSVEFGLSFGNEFVSQFKEQYAVDVALYIEKQGGFEAFASTLGDSLAIDSAHLTTALAGDAHALQTEIKGTPHAVYFRAIGDYSAKPIGVLSIAMDRSYYADTFAHTRNTLIGIGVLALAFGLGLLTLVSRGIVGPIKAAAVTMVDIGQGDGDLTRRLDDKGRDELTDLSRGFNHFADKLASIVRDVTGSASQVAAASEEMSTVMESTSEDVRKQQHETEQVAAAINEMTESVHEVSEHAGAAASAAQNAQQEADNGRQVVNSTITAINALADEVERATDAMHTLEEGSESIGSVLDVIKGIAEQTNLLALNAAIEAARAGEQGRGFAVVADEVRTLASRTQESTQEIQDMIERLQAGASNAVGVMEESRKRAQSSVDKAAEAGVSLENITAAVARISDMNLQIANAAEQQNSVTQEINRNIHNISKAVEGSAAGTSQTASASAELSRLSSELQTTVGQFKT